MTPFSYKSRQFVYLWSGMEGGVKIPLTTNSTLTLLHGKGNNIDNTGATIPISVYDVDVPSAFDEHQDEIDRRLAVNAKAKPFVLPAAEAFMTLPASWEWKLLVEVSALPIGVGTRSFPLILGRVSPEALLMLLR